MPLDQGHPFWTDNEGNQYRQSNKAQSIVKEEGTRSQHSRLFWESGRVFDTNYRSLNNLVGPRAQGSVNVDCTTVIGFKANDQ